MRQVHHRDAMASGVERRHLTVLVADDDRRHIGLRRAPGQNHLQRTDDPIRVPVIRRSTGHRLSV